MASAEGTDSIELESVFSSKNRDIHSSTLKSTSGTDDGKWIWLSLSFLFPYNSRKTTMQNTKRKRNKKKTVQNPCPPS